MVTDELTAVKSVTKDHLQKLDCHTSTDNAVNSAYSQQLVSISGSSGHCFHRYRFYENSSSRSLIGSHNSEALRRQRKFTGRHTTPARNKTGASSNKKTQGRLSCRRNYTSSSKWQNMRHCSQNGSKL